MINQYLSKNIFLLVATIIFLISVPSVYAEECKGDVNIFVQFRNFQEDNETDLHKYPNFVEGDYLQINKIVIRNLGNCETPIMEFNMIFYKLSGENFDFCPSSIVIGSVPPNETNVLSFYGETQDEAHGVRRGWLGYSDLQNNTYKWCGKVLLDPGYWGIKKNINMIDNETNLKLYFAILDDNNELRHGYINVISKNELAMTSYTKTLVDLSIILICLTIAIVALTIIQVYPHLRNYMNGN